MHEVAEIGEEIVITGRGRPVSRLVPCREPPEAMRNIKLLVSSGMSAVVTDTNAPAPPACWCSTNRHMSRVLPEPGTPSISTMPPLGSEFRNMYSA